MVEHSWMWILRTCAQRSVRVVVGVAAALCLVSAYAEIPEATRKRYVLFGFEFGRSRSPQVLLKTAPRFSDAGIDGLGIYLEQKTTVDGRKLSSPTDDSFAWKYEDYASDAPVYRKAFAEAGLHHNFLKTFFAAPRKHIDWDDDAAWTRISATMRALSKFAREAGFKGLCVDHEDYHHSSQFRRRVDEASYDALRKVVRARGRQVFSGVFEEFPDAELFFYWFLGWRDRFFTCRDTDAVLRDNEELWPAFANGILDVLPTTARIVDGDEWAYYHPEKEYFARSYNFRRIAVLGMVAPENRAKYHMQTSMGFGLYTDMYIVPKSSKFYRPSTDGSRLKTFSNLLAAATDASDEYVWFWNEKIQWAKWSPPVRNYAFADKTLEDYLPGLKAVCDAAKGTDGFIARRERELEVCGLLTNLVAGVDICAIASKANASGKAESRIFKFSLTNAVPGEYYAIKVAAKGPAVVTFHPKKAGSRLEWWDEMGKIYAAPFGLPDTNGWSRTQTLIRIPDGVDEMVLQLDWRRADGKDTQFAGLVLERLVWFDPDEHLIQQSRRGEM